MSERERERLEERVLTSDVSSDTSCLRYSVPMSGI